MAIVKKHPKTSTMPQYVEYFPQDYVEGEKLPVDLFFHGIGELIGKKTLDEFADFHSFLKKGTDKKRIITVLPQDDGSNLFDDKEAVQLMSVIDKYCNGQLFVCGLSRGAGTSISIAMSNSTVKVKTCGRIIMCPPTWEGMDEKLFDDVPTWIFAGAKDVADTATKIDRMVNTIDDIRRAGKGKNMYLSVFPNDDHYIWTEVMGAVGVPPINPANGAKSWKGFNTVTKVVNGVNTSVPVAIEVECVNNPAVDVYDFLLLQKPGDYKPLPLLSEVPTPAPPPVTPPTTKTLMRVNITGAGKPGMVNVLRQYTDKSDNVEMDTEVDISIGSKIRITIFNKTKVIDVIEL